MDSRAATLESFGVLQSSWQTLRVKSAKSSTNKARSLFKRCHRESTEYALIQLLHDLQMVLLPRWLPLLLLFYLCFVLFCRALNKMSFSHSFLFFFKLSRFFYYFGVSSIPPLALLVGIGRTG
jgi:hypothetical protein